MAEHDVVVALTDPAEIRRARLHSLKVLVALMTYAMPVGHIVEALYLAFDQVQPTSHRYLMALDVSGSMW